VLPRLLALLRLRAVLFWWTCRSADKLWMASFTPLKRSSGITRWEKLIFTGAELLLRAALLWWNLRRSADENSMASGMEQLMLQGSFSVWRRNCELAVRGTVPQGAASIRSVSQPATNASSPDVVAWEKEEALAATRRAVDALQKVSCGGGNDAFQEELRGVHLLLQAPGAGSAAKAFTLIAGVTRRCPERAKDSVKAAAREVRGVLVLRCLSEIELKTTENAMPSS